MRASIRAFCARKEPNLKIPLTDVMFQPRAITGNSRTTSERAHSQHSGAISGLGHDLPSGLVRL
jgi:hypothetical protein